MFALYNQTLSPTLSAFNTGVWVCKRKAKRADETGKHQPSLSIIKNGWGYYLISISDLELMGEIKRWVGGADCPREWWWNTAVVLGAFVAMEISREAIRNVQTMFE